MQKHLYVNNPQKHKIFNNLRYPAYLYEKEKEISPNNIYYKNRAKTWKSLKNASIFMYKVVDFYH